MTKRGLLAVVGFFSVCLSLAAQQPSRLSQNKGDAFALTQLHRVDAANSGSALLQPSRFASLGNPLWIEEFPGPVTFLNRDVFSLSTTFNLMGTQPRSFLPFSTAMESPRASLPATSAKNSSDRPFYLRPNFDYATGEVGFLYGRSSGKFGGEYMQGYIFGEVGNERIHITAGASYEEWNGRVPRWGR